MQMSFKEALKHAMKVTGRKSMRSVATDAGISYDILKNLNQDKSKKPNAEAATKVADLFGASLSDFYAGNIIPGFDNDRAEIIKDVNLVSEVVQHLGRMHRDQVRAFAEALLQTEEAARRSEERQTVQNEIDD